MNASDEKPFDWRVWLGASPWFYVACFCACGLAALLAISPKYSQRQAKIERNYQARSLVSASESVKEAALREEEMSKESEPVEKTASNDSSPDNKVGLLPMAVVLGLGLVVSVVVLGRQYLVALTADDLIRDDRDEVTRSPL